MYAAVENDFFFLLMTKGTFAKAMEQDKWDYVPNAKVSKNFKYLVKSQIFSKSPKIRWT